MELEIRLFHRATLADHITHRLLSVSLSYSLILTFSIECVLFCFVLKTKGKKSILDVDPEAQALLEMAGKSRQSEGLREPMEEDEEDDEEN